MPKDHHKADWQSSLFVSPFHQPLTCLASCCCPGLVAYRQRSLLLDLADEEYVCFGGQCDDCQCCCSRVFKRSRLNQPFENRTPALCLEAFCCTPFAVSSNRALLQKNFRRPDDMWSDCVCCCLMAFQLSQHANELEVIKDQVDALPSNSFEEGMLERARNFKGYGAACAAPKAPWQEHMAAPDLKHWSVQHVPVPLPWEI